jgi:hypothetical protein
MLSPETAQTMISEQPHLSKEALLSLASLLSLHAGKNRGYDNLLSTAVKECQGGHRGATGTIGPENAIPLPSPEPLEGKTKEMIMPGIMSEGSFAIADSSYAVR